MTASLPPHKQAKYFAKELTDLLNATVAKGVRIESWPEVPNNFWITVAGDPHRPTTSHLIALSTSPHIDNKPAFGLKIRYLVTCEGANQRLVVTKSWVALFAIHDKPKPIIRWEYVRNGGIEPGVQPTRKQRRQAAHVHVHGWSAELEEISNSTKTPAKSQISGNLERLHFPVGGRRFRPSIEDVLEFLSNHNFIERLHDGGARILEASRDKWLSIQLKAAINDDVETALEAMRELGYQITSADKT